MSTRAKQQAADLKIVIIGEASVGKTALMHKFVHDNFAATQSTIGVSFVLKQFKGLHLAIWDTAGMEKYAPLSSFYSREANAAVIAFDMTERGTFDAMPKYWDVLKNAKPDCRVVVVGCKSDLIDENPSRCAVTSDEARRLVSDRHALRYFETSAKTGQNVESVFDLLCKDLMPEKYDGLSVSRNQGTVRLAADSEAPVANEKPKGGCC